VATQIFLEFSPGTLGFHDPIGLAHIVSNGLKLNHQPVAIASRPGLLSELCELLDPKPVDRRNLEVLSRVGYQCDSNTRGLLQGGAPGKPAISIGLYNATYRGEIRPFRGVVNAFRSGRGLPCTLPSCNHSSVQNGMSPI